MRVLVYITINYHPKTNKAYEKYCFVIVFVVVSIQDVYEK